MATSQKFLRRASGSWQGICWRGALGVRLILTCSVANCDFSVLVSTCSRPPEDLRRVGNTTHGSGWIVQAQPTERADRPFVLCFSLSPRAAKGERRRGNRNPTVRSRCRLGLNNPPTAVGGIRGSTRALFVCRQGLNDPPTAVGGIPGALIQTNPSNLATCWFSKCSSASFSSST